MSRAILACTAATEERFLCSQVRRDTPKGCARLNKEIAVCGVFQFEHLRELQYYKCLQSTSHLISHADQASALVLPLTISFLAAPLKVTVRQQGGKVEGREQVKLGSSSKLPLL